MILGHLKLTHLTSSATGKPREDRYRIRFRHIPCDLFHEMVRS